MRSRHANLKKRAHRRTMRADEIEPTARSSLAMPRERSPAARRSRKRSRRLTLGRSRFTRELADLRRVE